MQNIDENSRINGRAEPARAVTTQSDGLFRYAGRIGRVEYFLTTLTTTVIGGISFFLAEVSSQSGFGLGTWLAISVTAPLIYVGALAAIKRCHDLGKSGWLSLVCVIPLFNVVLGLYLLFTKGMRDANQYGQPLAEPDSPSNGPSTVLQANVATQPAGSTSLVRTELARDQSTGPVGVTGVAATSFGNVADVKVNTIKAGIPTEEYWATALAEVEGINRRPGLWARAFSDALGVEPLAKANYLRDRAQELHREHDELVWREQVRSEAVTLEEAQQAATPTRILTDELANAEKDKGYCPNCDMIIPLISDHCPNCTATFGIGSTWTVRPRPESLATVSNESPVLRAFIFISVIVGLISISHVFSTSIKDSKSVGSKSKVVDEPVPEVAPVPALKIDDGRMESLMESLFPTSKYVRQPWYKCSQELRGGMRDEPKISELSSEKNQYGITYDLLVSTAETIDTRRSRRLYKCQISRAGELISLDWMR